MKVLLLGAGIMGKGGVRALEHFPGVESVTVADMDLENAEKFASILNFPEVRAVQLDVTDEDRLIALAREVDVVFNAVGPFVKFGVPTLEAVIKAGTDYVDVCDDGDATRDLLGLHEKAKAAGITALIGCGQTPGISNMQAKYLAERMDVIENVKIAWAGVAPAEVTDGLDLGDASETYLFDDAIDFRTKSPAAWNHLVHSCTGEIPVWRGGKFDTIPAWDSGQYVDFAEPYGRVAVYYVGHSEPMTLPLYLDIRDSCVCLGTNRFHRELRLEARGHAEPLDPPQWPDSPVWETPASWQGKGVWRGQAAIVEGMKDGRPVRLTSRYMCSMHDRGMYIFAGQAIGIYLIGTMRDKQKGVFPPEGILATDAFFTELVRATNEGNGWDMTLEELIPIEEEDLTSADENALVRGHAE